MNIGIIGSGTVGGTLGGLWAKAGHHVMFSFSHDSKRLRTLASQIGDNATSGTPAEAANFGDVILFAPNFWSAKVAIAQAGSLAGKIVIDTTNPYRWSEEEGLIRMVHESVSGVETLEKLMPGARLVKAYSSFRPTALLQLATEPMEKRLAVAISTNDAAAKSTVTQLVEDSGGRPFDLGSLDNAKLMEIPGTFSLSDDLTLNTALEKRLQVLGY